MALITRFLLFLATPITALFVSRDALNFGVIQTLVATLLIVAIVLIAALWQYRRNS